MANLSQKIILDVRTREEYVQNHIKGALNIPVHDLEHYHDFLKDKTVYVYCNSGARANLAKTWLHKAGIYAELLKGDWQHDHPRRKQHIISAINFIMIKPEKEKEFQKNITQLCQKTNEINGFLGSKLFKISGASAKGSYLPGNLTDVAYTPNKCIIVTYWTDKQSHEQSHKLAFFKKIYDTLPLYCTQTPYEEFYEILK